MKKIMFNDKYGLTRAGLDGRKTMTRRIVPGKLQEHLNACGNPVLVVPLECIPQGMTIEEFAQAWNRDAGKLRVMLLGQDERIQFIDQRKELIKNAVRYKVGEVVAVAQSYNDSGWNPNTLQQTFVKEPTVFPDLDPISPLSGWIDLPLKYHKGWSNKMFVLADLMPHQIRITKVRVERLQDISDEDCLREGIFFYNCGIDCGYTFFGERHRYGNPRNAFAALIDKVSGKGTFDSNPWVFVYEFELVK